MPVDLETQHVFFIGAPGAGKTVFLNNVIDQTFNRKNRSIIYDFKGDFVSSFYRPEKDFLFNPIDQRCVGWNLFNEIKTDYDIEAISCSLIPEGKGDTIFWNTAARNVFISVLKVLIKREKKTHMDLWRTLTMPLNELADYIFHEEGYTYIQDPQSRQAASVVSVLMQYARCFYYMQHVDGDFSVKKWFEQTQNDSSIFITNYADIRDTLDHAIDVSFG
jgi:type IV secretory pathway TraG/TraD family ATPase VirD4